MSKRLRKQMIYGGSFLVFWALVFAGIYFLWFRPAPSCFDNRQNQSETGVDCGGSCIPCELKNIQPVIADSVRFLLAGSKVTLLGKIINPNINYGAAELDYEFMVYGEGDALLKTIPGKTFIYGNRYKYIIEPGLDLEFAKIRRIELSLNNPLWKSAQEFAMPALQQRESKTDVSGKDIVISGIIVNNSNLAVSYAVAQALLQDALGNVIGASQTEVRDLAASQNRRFEIHHPALLGVDPQRTQVLYEAKF